MDKHWLSDVALDNTNESYVNDVPHHKIGKLWERDDGSKEPTKSIHEGAFSHFTNQSAESRNSD